MGYGDPLYIKSSIKRRWTWWMETGMVLFVLVFAIGSFIMYPYLKLRDMYKNRRMT